ncbi:protein mono-ADP-ribosyltransferase PARP14-like [Gigantopelta aegis]|uniref:protein mono-ADP-ribosyltransferase PARP14-like n=1 Tax=Gigantopelta aegis TaxID=1735272 RepID=UPI001B88C0E3|nr:protein mono-ADP-ribosyltransferase PARP14-like [Gigantopelta aegis]
MDETLAATDNTDVTSKTIEVRGFKPEISNDTLELYFENSRKGGGEIAEFQQCGDVIYITFVESEVAKKVVERTNRIGDCDLQVEFSTHPAPTPLPTYDDRLLVTGIGNSTTRECLINYLEVIGQCEINNNNVVYGDKEGMAVVIFDETPDIETFIERCAKRSLEGSMLTVSKVPVSNVITVRGLNSRTAEDTVCDYFKGKRSGNTEGVEVEKVWMKSSDGYCMVHFRDHTAVEQILRASTGHSLDDATLDVSVYHECLSSGGASLEIPAPVEIKDLDKHKLKFMKESAAAPKETLLKDLELYYAELDWSESDDSSVTLTCTLTAEKPDACSVSQTWATDVEKALLKYLDLLEVEEIPVIQDIWDRVMTKLDARHTDDVSVFALEEDVPSLVVVGYAAGVKKMAEEVKSLVKEIENAYEREKQVVLQTDNGVKMIQLRLLLASGFLKQMADRFPGFTVDINVQKAEVSFQGVTEEVSQAQAKMHKLLKNIKQSTLSSLTKGQLQMIKKKNVQDYIAKKMKSKNLVGAWEVTADEVTADEVTVVAFSDDDATDVAEMISKSVVENRLKLDAEAMVLLSSSYKWKSFIAELSRAYGDVLEITYEAGNHDVTIIATDDNIVAVTQRVDQFILDNAVYTQSVMFSSGIKCFLQKYCETEINQIMSDQKNLQVCIQYTSSEFTINATKKGMDSAKKALQILASKIEHKKYRLKRAGIHKLIESQRGLQFIAGLESRERCIIKTELDEGQTLAVESHHTMECTASADCLSNTSTNQGELRDVHSPSEMCLYYFSDKPTHIIRCIELTECFCEEEIMKKRFEDELLKSLNSAQTEKVRTLENDFQVSVAYQEELGQLQIQGLQQDVSNASDAVHKIIRESLEEKHRLYCSQLERQLAELKTKLQRMEEQQQGNESKTNTLEIESTRFEAVEVSGGEQLVKTSIESPVRASDNIQCRDSVAEAEEIHSSIQAIAREDTIMYQAITSDLQMIDSDVKDVVNVYGEDNIKEDVVKQRVEKVLKKVIKEPKKKKALSSTMKMMDSRPNVGFYSVPRKQTKSTSDTSGPQPVVRGKLLDVMVYKGDIIQLSVDAVVTAANTKLTATVGIAKAIAEAAGDTLVKEGRRYVQVHGELKVSGVVATTAGRLPYKKVLHAVGPAYSDYTDKAKCLEDLCKTILRCLCEARKLNVTSVAIPSISSGIYKVPKPSCAEMYVRAVKSFDNVVTGGSLKQVHFVDIDDAMSQLISQEFVSKWSAKVDDTVLSLDSKFIKQCLPDDSRRSSSTGDNIFSFGVAAVAAAITPFTLPFSPLVAVAAAIKTVYFPSKPSTHGGIQVFVYKEDILNVVSQAVVCWKHPNPTGNDQDIAQKILDRAGEKYQNQLNEIKRKHENKFPSGLVFTADCANMHQSLVCHGVISPSEGRSSLNMIPEVIAQVDQNKMTSVVIPLTQGLSSDGVKVFTEILCKAIKDFSQQNPQSALKEIHVVDTDQKMVDVIGEIVEKRGIRSDLKKGN